MADFDEVTLITRTTHNAMLKCVHFMFLCFSGRSASLPLFGTRADLISFRSFALFLLSSFFHTEEYVSFIFSLSLR